MSFSRATLTASKPFSSFTIPGTNPTVVVNRRGALLDAETTKLLKKALKAGEVPNVKPEDVAIETIDAPGKPDASSSDATELRARIEELEDELAEARADTNSEDLDAMTVERNELATKVETLEAQVAESDASALASGILDSMTVPQLSELAKARKVEGLTSSSTKAETIAAIVGQPASAE